MVAATCGAVAGCGGGESQPHPARKAGARVSATATVTPQAHATADLTQPPDPDDTSGDDASQADVDAGQATTVSPAGGNVIAGVPRPNIVWKPIPFGSRRLAETAAYARRHYGLDTWRLRRPRVIVEHYTVTPTLQAAFDTFARDIPDTELHELPGTCSHFVVDRDGTIYQLVRTTVICRHTVGLNYTAIGIEHVGVTQPQVLGDRAQMRASLRLTDWLRCRYRIKTRNVIGHAESLRSPYHHEDVAVLRTQTHADWPTSAMRVYRAQLAREPAC